MPRSPKHRGRSADATARYARLAMYRRQVYDFFEAPDTRAAQTVNFLILLVIVFSICCLIGETTKAGKSMDPIFWFAMEAFSSTVFTLEYVLRLAACTEAIPRFRFVFSPANLVDLVAIIPFYVDLAFRLAGGLEGAEATEGLRVFRAVRLLRLFRLFRSATAYSSGLKVMGKALKLSFQALWVLVFWTIIGVVIFSSCVYFTEKLECPVMLNDEVDPEFVKSSKSEMEYAEFIAAYWADCPPGTMGWSESTGDRLLCCTRFGAPAQFQSIFRTFWWTMVTMTCVGYGEEYPFTTAGRLVAILCMICGILLISLPTAIVGAKFQQVYQEVENERKAAEEGRRTKMMALHAKDQWSNVDWSLRPELDDVGTVLEGCLDQELALSRRLRSLRTEQHMYTNRLLSEIRGLEIMSLMLQTEIPPQC